MNRLKSLLLPLIFLFSSSLFGQLEKNLLLLNGSFNFEEQSITVRNSDEFESRLNLASRLGYSVNPHNMFGVELQYQLYTNRTTSFSTGFISRQREMFIDFSPYYRRYFLPLSRFNFFGEAQLKLNLQTSSEFQIPNSFLASLRGAIGAQFFMTENNAFEFSFQLPIWRLDKLANLESIRLNLAFLRTFKRPGREVMAKLEDRYLFVRNMYYGFGLTNFYTYDNPNPSTTLRNEVLVDFDLNLGFFLSKWWLLDFKIDGNSIQSIFSRNFINEFSIESAFFFRLNKSGLYLRPAFIFSMNETRFIRDIGQGLINSSLFAVSYAGHLEVAYFSGSRLIFGGGMSSIIYDRFDTDTDIYYAAVLRSTYFITNDLALECVANFPFASTTFFNPFSDGQLAQTLTQFDFTLRAFLFQK